MGGLQFAQDDEGKWGYKVGGADPVIPFSNVFVRIYSSDSGVGSTKPVGGTLSIKIPKHYHKGYIFCLTYHSLPGYPTSSDNNISLQYNGSSGQTGNGGYRYSFTINDGEGGTITINSVDDQYIMIAAYNDETDVRE